MNLDPEYKGPTAEIKEYRDKLRDAVYNKDHENLKLLLSNANLQMINYKYYNETTLDLATSLGDLTSVELLLDHGAIPKDSHSSCIWGKSTLSLAILNGNFKLIRKLISRGLHPDDRLSGDHSRASSLLFCPYNYWYKVMELKNLPIFRCMWESSSKKGGNDECPRKNF